MNPIIFLWIGGVLVVLAVFVGIILSISSQRSAEEKRLDAFVDAGVELPPKAGDRSAAVTDWLSTKVEKTTWSGKVAKDPITGDTQAEFKSQGTEGHGLPFVSFVGGVIGGFLGGAGGTLIYLQLLNLYEATLPALMKVPEAQVMPIAVAAAGMFAVGLFLVNAVLTAYNITGTIEGPHDPKFKRWPRAIVASAVASALCGVVAILIVAL